MRSGYNGRQYASNHLVPVEGRRDVQRAVAARCCAGRPVNCNERVGSGDRILYFDLDLKDGWYGEFEPYLGAMCQVLRTVIPEVTGNPLCPRLLVVGRHKPGFGEVSRHIVVPGQVVRSTA
jgi:hypothetical protein